MSQSSTPDFFDATNRGVAPSDPSPPREPKPAAAPVQGNLLEGSTHWLHAQFQQARDDFEKFTSARQPNAYETETGKNPTTAYQDISSTLSSIDTKAIGEAGGKISSIMKGIEDSSRAATQSITDYRNGVTSLGEATTEFAKQIPVIGESLKAGEALGGLVGYALFGVKTPDMIKSEIDDIDQRIQNMVNAKKTSQNVIEAEKDRLEDMQYEAERKKIDPSDSTKLEEFDDRRRYKGEIKAADRRLHEGWETIDAAAEPQIEKSRKKLDAASDADKAKYASEMNRYRTAAQDARNQLTSAVDTEKLLIGRKYHQPDDDSLSLKASSNLSKQPVKSDPTNLSGTSAKSTPTLLPPNFSQPASSALPNQSRLGISSIPSFIPKSPHYCPVIE